VDSATATLQNGFFSYKLSLHKKNQFYSGSDKNILYFFIPFIFYHRALVTKRSLYYTLLELCKQRFVMRPMKNTPLWNSTAGKCKKSSIRKFLTKIVKK
jgi:hypothetical protein